jgi:two-component system, OmpR family, alkaline phosphatase synthesis response regulator PhoP
MMQATAKARLVQPIRPFAETPRVRAVFLDSAAQVRMLDLNELEKLSQLVPLIVLVSKTQFQDQVAPSQIAIQSAKQTAVGKTQPLGLLEKSLDRLGSPNPQNESVFGDVRINFPEMTAQRKGKPVELTNMEFKTLKYLTQNPRLVISRDRLLNEVWGYENYPCTRTVDNHILRLRQKFEQNPSRPIHFLTVHGAGYKFLP